MSQPIYPRPVSPMSTNNASRPPWDRNQSNRVNSWSHIEEVFLVGAIMQRWFQRGSLAPARDNNNDDCWDEILQHYDFQWHIYCSKTGDPKPVQRTSSALMRHFKIMKSSLSQPTESPINLRELYLEWEIKYNSEAFDRVLNTARMKSSVVGEIVHSYASTDATFTDTSQVEMLQHQQDVSLFGRDRSDSKRKFDHVRSRYYNTVQGADGEKMARQLQIERTNFGRSLHFELGNTQGIGFNHPEAAYFDELGDAETDPLFTLNEVFANDDFPVPTVPFPHQHLAQSYKTSPPTRSTNQSESEENSLFTLFGLSRNP